MLTLPTHFGWNKLAYSYSKRKSTSLGHSTNNLFRDSGFFFSQIWPPNYCQSRQTKVFPAQTSSMEFHSWMYIFPDLRVEKFIKLTSRMGRKAYDSVWKRQLNGTHLLIQMSKCVTSSPNFGGEHSFAVICTSGCKYEWTAYLSTQFSHRIRWPRTLIRASTPTHSRLFTNRTSIKMMEVKKISHSNFSFTKLKI